MINKRDPTWLTATLIHNEARREGWQTLARNSQCEQSGNPGGRPRVLRDVQELAREKSPEAIETLSNIMHDTKAPPAARVAAANPLLDRGYGKPTQPISQTLTKVDPSSLSEKN